jgi:hypothetical protein
MEKKQKMFLGFTVIVIMVIFTVAGCDLFKEPEFPSEFKGTWKREGINNTLTITASTYKLSHQTPHWILVDVSGDTYTLSQSDNRDHKGKETIRFVNGKLEISPCTGLDNCGGTWIRQ